MFVILAGAELETHLRLEREAQERALEAIREQQQGLEEDMSESDEDAGQKLVCFFMPLLEYPLFVRYIRRVFCLRLLV